jgi:hypothetical protein
VLRWYAHEHHQHPETARPLSPPNKSLQRTAAGALRRAAAAELDSLGAQPFIESVNLRGNLGRSRPI